jgi:thiosulfate reductase cytochrome b subunit
VFPFLVTVFGGQQSARTIHFFVACALLLFSLIHVALVGQTGFNARMKGMITGRRAPANGLPNKDAS